MQFNRLPAMAMALGCLLALPQLALATKHLWDISEVYSNADGSVQFIEMTTASNGQNQLASHLLIANSNGNEITFVIPNNAPNSNTRNQRLLFATANFAGLDGAVTPDHILPEGSFFDPTADSIRISFADPSGSPFDALIFSSDQLPDNGLDSLNADKATIYT